LIVSFRYGYKFGFGIQKTNPFDPDKVGALSSRHAELSAFFLGRKIAIASPFDFRTLE